MNHIAYSLLEQASHQAIARDSDVDSELQRLEHKIDLVIQMLGNLQQSRQTRPKAITLKLGAETIAWQVPELAIGQHCMVTLFLSEAIAIPIQAHVEIIERDGEWCVARFVSQSPDEQTAWEHWVFRLHRRQIATARA